MSEATLTKKDLKNLDKFKKKMVKKLNSEKNKQKKHWQCMTVEDLFILLFDELLELKEEIFTKKSTNFHATKEECLDIAAFAFFIYDNFENEILEDLLDWQEV